MTALKILTIVGARPQFVKAAAVSRALRDSGTLEVMIHTGQHFDPEMSDIFFEELDIPTPAHYLGIHGGRHGEMTGRMLTALEPILLHECPSWVVVYGDTNSTLAGALAASKLNLPIAHVEAGLRSFNRRMPEEINRVLADHLASMHLCPTRTAVKNLAEEGITRGVHHIGDVMYDAALFALQRATERTNILAEIGLTPGGYAVATVHRAENTDDPRRLREIVAWLEDRASEQPIVFPVHPRTRDALARINYTPSHLKLIPPLSYLDMTGLVANSVAVFTDSGGLQKEAYFHQKPCVTLRDETEWVETVESGWNRLWRCPDYLPRRPITDYGSGDAAQIITKLLRG